MKAYIKPDVAYIDFSTESITDIEGGVGFESGEYDPGLED